MKRLIILVGILFCASYVHAQVIQARLLPFLQEGKPTVEYHISGVDKTEVRVLDNGKPLVLPYMPAHPTKGIFAATWMPIKENLLVIRTTLDAKPELYIKGEFKTLDVKDAQLNGPYLAFIGGKVFEDGAIVKTVHQVPPTQFYHLNKEDVFVQTGPLVAFKQGSKLVDAYKRVAFYTLENKSVFSVEEVLPEAVKITEDNLHLAGLYQTQIWGETDLQKNFDKHYFKGSSTPYAAKLRGWFGIVSPFSRNVVQISLEQDASSLKRSVFTAALWADTLVIPGWTTWIHQRDASAEVTEKETLLGKRKDLNTLKDTLLVGLDTISSSIALNDQQVEGAYYVSLWGKDGSKAVFLDNWGVAPEKLVELVFPETRITENVENLPAVLLLE